MEKLVIAGREFNSRLFLGTGKFNSNEVMEQAILASGTEMVTVAMKRIDMDDKEDDMLKHIIHPHIQLLPNTSGVRDAEEAVFAAQMAREAFGTNWLKLEIHPDPRYLLPDSIETLKATEELVKLGFVVLPYCQADPVLCKRLEEAGAATPDPYTRISLGRGSTGSKSRFVFRTWSDTHGCVYRKGFIRTHSFRRSQCRRTKTYEKEKKTWQQPTRT